MERSDPLCGQRHLSEPIIVFALGAGVQSSVVALMAARGEIQAPVACVFADTQGEPASVYQWLSWLEKQLPFPVYRVTAGDLAADQLVIHTAKVSGNRYISADLPAFVRHDTGKIGMMGRKCTADYKITPVTQQLRRMLGIKSVRPGSGVLVNLALGISMDEVIRMKPSRFPWIKHYWPLIDLGMTRDDCKAWMKSHGYPEPPRSACSFCPFHSDDEWIRLRDDEPDAFAQAVQFEKDLQHAATQQDVLKGVPYLHDSATPLSSVKFQASHNSADIFGNECEGLCGV